VYAQAILVSSTILLFSLSHSLSSSLFLSTDISSTQETLDEQEKKAKEEVG